VKDKRAKSAYAERSLYNTQVRSTLGDQPMNHLSRKDVVTLGQAMKDRRFSVATINKVISTIRVIVRYAITLEYLSDSEVLSTKLLADTAKKERFLSIEETQRLLRVLDTWHVKPIALLLKLLIFTGARSGEAMKANWTDIDFKQGVWKIPIESDKIKQGRLVPLNDHALSVLQQAWALREAGQVEVFRSIQCNCIS
jgi:integrase